MTTYVYKIFFFFDIELNSSIVCYMNIRKHYIYTHLFDEQQ